MSTPNDDLAAAVTARQARRKAALRRKRRNERLAALAAGSLVAAVVFAVVGFVPFFVMLLLGNFGATQWGFGETFAALLPVVPLAWAWWLVT